MTDWTVFDDEYYEQFETKFNDRGVVIESNVHKWRSELDKRNERLRRLRSGKE